MNPVATMLMENGQEIVIELIPEAAPNTVDSFISAAQKGVFDHHNIERIVPKDWIDVSYSGFGKEEGRYLIPYEFDLHPEIVPLNPVYGCVCMGGYGEYGEAGCEFFFPMRDCPEHKGKYPVFGRVISGMEELERIRNVPIEAVTDYPYSGIEVNRPIKPERIKTVKIAMNGRKVCEPIKVTHSWKPACWK